MYTYKPTLKRHRLGVMYNKQECCRSNTIGTEP